MRILQLPLLDQFGGMNPVLRNLLRLSVAEIVENLDSTDKYVKGLALEALGFKLMTIVGLKYVGTYF